MPEEWRQLDNDEADQLYELLDKLKQEQNMRLVSGDWDSTTYLQIIRGKDLRYLEQEYDIE